MKVKMMVVLILANFALIRYQCFGQDNKPTKEQTIDWLENHYEYDIYQSACQKDKGIFQMGRIKTQTFSIHKDTLYVFYEDSLTINWISNNNFKNTREQFHYYRFALKDIESISMMRMGEIGEFFVGDFKDVDYNSMFPYYLVFRVKDGKNLVYYNGYYSDNKDKYYSQARVPFTNAAKSENDTLLNNYKDLQLFKAFEHLRKLCGAPEPLRF